MNMIKFNSLAPRNNFFEDFFEDFFQSDMMMNENRSAKFTDPLVNILEGKEAFTIEMAIPGVRKEDVAIDLNKDQLIIKAEAKESEENENTEFTRKEFFYGTFEKSYFIPESVDRNAIHAEFRDGVLYIEMKKKEEAIDKGPQQIEIK